MAIHHQPIMLYLTCYVQWIYRKKYHAIKESHQGVCVGGGGEGRLFYCIMEAASLIKGVLFCWDIRGNYATKSTVAEYVKRLCMGCVDELLAAFLEFPGIDGEAG